ncbi:hypothetical protein QOZ94_000846 [Xanthobacter agilis]|uniref:Uncharacterized protein n=1 Tax=Xanthobacter agilis TaxID=47492 RepID=A0ABU0LAA4_XANAG|nr:hypothetical protein [Xanthobacter agilis]
MDKHQDGARRMQTVVTIMLIGAVMMVAIAALDRPQS